MSHWDNTRYVFRLGDVTEVQLKRLGAPHYLHELVLRLFVRAIERGERETSLASALTDRLSRHGVLGAETAKKVDIRQS